MIPREEYINIISKMPVACIDLIVLYDNKILVGKRKNNPIKDEWFVPGGRILHGETINEATLRIWKDEIGGKFDPSLMPNGNFVNLGPYTHIYEATEDYPMVHCITLGRIMVVDQDTLISNMGNQHSSWKFKSLESDDFHPYVWNYIADCPRGI